MTLLTKKVVSEVDNFNEFILTLYPNDKPEKKPKYKMSTNMKGDIILLDTKDKNLIKYVKDIGLTEE